MDDKSKVLKCRNYNWDSVERKEYKSDTDSFKKIDRYSLLGDDQSALNFHTRYFEIQPGGYSSLEYHRHPHSVVVIRGKGTVILGNNLYNLGLHDVVYIAPGTIHQFQAAADDTLGFLCTVDRYRDRPKKPNDEEIHSQIENTDVLDKIRRS